MIIEVDERACKSIFNVLHYLNLNMIILSTFLPTNQHSWSLLTDGKQKTLIPAFSQLCCPGTRGCSCKPTTTFVGNSRIYIIGPRDLILCLRSLKIVIIKYKLPQKVGKTKKHQVNWLNQLQKMVNCPNALFCLSLGQAYTLSAN